MKILYLLTLFPTPNNFSVGIFNYHRVQKLKSMGCNIFVVKYNNILNRHLKYSIKKNYVINSIPVTILNTLTFPFVFSYTLTLFLLKRFIKKNKIDLIQTDLIINGYLGALLKEKLKIPLVVTAHGSDIHTLPAKSHSLKKKLLYSLEKADKVIFVSHFLLNKAKKLGYNDKNAIVIPNGVDLSLFNINNKIKKEKYILYAGNLFSIKGVDRLPYIYKNIIKYNPNIPLWIVGSGNLQKKIEKKFEDLGLLKNVSFVGKVKQKQLSHILRKAKVLLLPSRNEGYPNIITEANACGVPVVASDVGGVSEALGQGGLLIQEGKTFEEDFAKAVIQLYDNPIQPQILFNRVKEKSWEQVAIKERTIYQSIIKRNIESQ